MSSNIRVKRICQFCNTEFVAKTTVTKFCSDKCAKRAYKENLKKNKIQKSNKETQKIKNPDLFKIKEKEFLSLLDASTLTGVSLSTINRLIRNGLVPKIKIGRRTILKRSYLDKYLNSSEITNTTKEATQSPEILKTFIWSISDCYTIGEAQKTLEISSKALYEVLKRNKIPKKRIGKNTYVPKELLNNILK